MTALKERTKQAFGDYADALLDAGAVFPVNKNKAPALGRGVSWKPPTDPNANYGNYWGLAVKTGQASGITVVDFDTKDSSVKNINVETLRGSHVWVPYDNDRCAQNRDVKVDVRGDGGYAVFTSPFHHVLSSSLQDRDSYLDYLTQKDVGTKSYSSSSNNNKVFDNGVHNNQEPTYMTTDTYLQEVKGYGYEIDTEWLANRLAGQVEGTAEGSRNARLYVNLVQVINLGATEGQIKRVVDAGFKSGLDPQEVIRTVESARRAPGVIPVMHGAHQWADRAHAAMKSPVIEELVRLATEQHNFVPLVSKKGLAADAGIPLSTIKRHLAKMELAGLVEEHVNPGWRLVNGRKVSNANNYRLLGDSNG